MSLVSLIKSILHPAASTPTAPITPAPVSSAEAAATMASTIIGRFEGCVLTAYQGLADRPGLLTIAWGSTSLNVRNPVDRDH